jgi:hypothetical protein
VSGANEDARSWYEFDSHFNDTNGNEGGFTSAIGGSGVINGTSYRWGNGSLMLHQNETGNIWQVSAYNSSENASIFASIWHYGTNKSSNDYIINFIEGDGTNERLWIRKSGDTGEDLVNFSFINATDSYHITTYFTEEVWEMYTIIFDNSTGELIGYKNTTEIGRIFIPKLHENLGNLRVGGTDSTSVNNYDHLIILRAGDNTTMINNLYNNGTTYVEVPSVNTTILYATSPYLSDCVGDWNTTYTCNNTFDDNWSSYGASATGSVNGRVYFNYTIPIGVIVGDWELKTDLYGGGGSGTIVNYTLPSECIVGKTNQTTELSVFVDALFTNRYAEWFCRDATDWFTLGETLVGDHGQVFEGQMWWYNTLPEAQNVNISFPIPSLDNITCEYDYSDPNNHTEQTTFFDWFINDTSIDITDQTLLAGNYTVYDNITCSVRVYDGFDNSTWANSTTIIVNDVYNIFTISIFDSQTESNIQNFSITITSNTYPSWDGETNVTTEYNSTHYLVNSTNYTLTITSDGYATNVLNYTLLVNTSLNVSMELANSIRIQVYNLTDLELMSQLVSVNTISNITSYSNTTTNGIIYFTLVPNDYEFRFESDGFSPISAFTTVLNDSTQNLTVYLTPNSTLEIQAVEVLDTSNSPVEDAIVVLQRQIINGSNQWFTVQEAQTDFEGKTSVWVEKNTTIFYRFAVIFEGVPRRIQPSGNLFTGETSFIPGVTETIQIIIDTEDDPSDIIGDRYSVSVNTYWTGADNNSFFFEWIDSRSNIIGGKLTIRGKFLNSTTEFENIDNLTLNVTVGTLNYTLPVINNTIFEVTAIIVYPEGEEIARQEFKRFEVDVVTEKNLGLLFAALVLIVVALISVRFGALLSSIFTIGSLYVLVRFSLVDISIAIISSLIALAIILFFKMNKGGKGEIG